LRVLTKWLETANIIIKSREMFAIYYAAKFHVTAMKIDVSNVSNNVTQMFSVYPIDATNFHVKRIETLLATHCTSDMKRLHVRT
jgi:hypothetical protein